MTAVQAGSRRRKERFFEVRPRLGLLRIQKYILIEITLNFLLTFIILSFLFFVILSLKILYKNPDLSFFFLVKGFPFLIPYSFPYTIPMSFLVAIVLTYGRLSADNEILAMQTTGIHLYWATSPALLLGILLSISSFLVNDQIVPYSYFRTKTLAQDAAETLLSYLRGSKRSISLRNFKMSWEDYEGEDFLNCLILAKGLAGEGTQRIFAKRCRISMDRTQGMVIFKLIETKRLASEIDDWEELEKGNEKKEKPATLEPRESQEGVIKKREKRIPFEAGEVQLSIRLKDLFSQPHRKKRLEEHHTSDLINLMGNKDVKLYPTPNEETKSLKIFTVSEICTEIHKRLSLSLAPLAFALVGAPIGILFRRRNRLVSFIISFLLVILLYYPFVTFGETLGCNGTVPPFAAMWSGNFFLVVVGFLLLVKVLRK